MVFILFIDTWLDCPWRGYTDMFKQNNVYFVRLLRNNDVFILSIIYIHIYIYLFILYEPFIAPKTGWFVFTPVTNDRIFIKSPEARVTVIAIDLTYGPNWTFYREYIYKYSKCIKDTDSFETRLNRCVSVDREIRRWLLIESCSKIIRTVSLIMLVFNNSKCVHIGLLCVYVYMSKTEYNW